ncbi:MAG: TraB/GumN family protein [Novosphingobium meiothermophilum]|uniref:TraB/GumN family protein n=1 Tax=Novosphingobium TaxID=165696 RepID=UPI000D6E4CCF|nr:MULTISPECIES: TraB/GumN family protein [Novosphingobium]
MIQILRRLCAAIALSALALAVPSGIPAQARPAKAAPALQQAPAAQPLRPALWKVADADTTIYLFGTVHALPKGLVWFEGAVAQAFAASDELVMEIPDVSPDAQARAALSRGTLRGETLRSLMDEQSRAAYEALLARLNIRPETYDGLEPWLAAISLAVLPYAQAGYLAQDGAEATLGTAAKAQNKARNALESVEYQIAMFADLPRAAQLRFLDATVRDFSAASGVIARMTEVWGKGDTEALGRLLNAQMTDADLAEALLYQRNRNWASWIRQRLDRPGTVFVAVGAGHLAGADSVQDALDRLGITAQRVQ